MWYLQDQKEVEKTFLYRNIEQRKIVVAIDAMVRMCIISLLLNEQRRSLDLTL